jgi:hypothetical protein
LLIETDLYLAPGDDVVLWQTAFWGLIPIVMNSMLQANGMVLSFPSTWGIALRSSPIFCLFDSIDLTLFWLTLVVFNGESPRVAAKRIARVRFQDVQDNASDQSLASLRRNFWVIQVGFVLATSTAAIKIFAYHERESN